MDGDIIFCFELTRIRQYVQCKRRIRCHKLHCKMHQIGPLPSAAMLVWTFQHWMAQCPVGLGHEVWRNCTFLGFHPKGIAPQEGGLIGGAQKEAKAGHLKPIVVDFEELFCNLIGRRQWMDVEGKATVIGGICKKVRYNWTMFQLGASH